MTDIQKRMFLYEQYTQAYGELTHQGLYKVGDKVWFDRGRLGNILWKYIDKNQQLIYIIDDGFPVEVESEDIERKDERRSY